MMIQKHIGYTGWNDDFPHEVLPKVYYIKDTDPADFIFKDTTGYIIMEAEHAQYRKDASKACWTVIPYMGRTLSGISLQPYTAATDSASLTYVFCMNSNGKDSADVHIITKCTLDFLHKGGLTFTVSLDGGTPVTVNFNKNLNEDPKNIYTSYYPTVARRVVESIIRMPVPKTSDGIHILIIHPLDPGIVFEKLIVNLHGYQPQFLFGKESPRIRK
jgi:hypothetical protein